MIDTHTPQGEHKMTKNYYVTEGYARPWKPTAATTLGAAKRAASQMAAFYGTRLAVGVHTTDGMRIVCEKQNARSPWERRGFGGES